MMFGAVRKLCQFRTPPDDIVEIRRLAPNRHPDGGIIRRPPSLLGVNSPLVYWKRTIAPRLEDGAGRQGFAMALGRIVGKK